MLQQACLSLSFTNSCGTRQASRGWVNNARWRTLKLYLFWQQAKFVEKRDPKINVMESWWQQGCCSLLFLSNLACLHSMCSLHSTGCLLSSFPMPSFLLSWHACGLKLIATGLRSEQAIAVFWLLRLINRHRQQFEPELGLMNILISSLARSAFTWNGAETRFSLFVQVETLVHFGNISSFANCN